MLQRRSLFAILLTSLLLTLIVNHSWAQSLPPDELSQVNYCARSTYNEDRCIPFSEYTTLLVKRTTAQGLIGLTNGISWLIWQAGRLVVHISRFVVQGEWEETLRRNILAAIQQVVPPALDRLLFDAQNGLMFIMLFVVGILLILPFGNLAHRVVGKRAEVFLWGFLIAFFFVRTFLGYDLVQEFDALRVSIMRLVFGDPEQGLAFESPFLNPFMARPDEVNTIDGNLPQVYRAVFFPQPDTYQITVILGAGPMIGNVNVINLNLETDESLTRRVNLAFSSLFYALLGLVGFLIVFTCGLVVFIVNLSAIAAIVLFFAALPAGFFTPGRNLILRIVNIYLMSIILGILTGGVMRVLGAVSWVAPVGGVGGDLSPLRIIPALVMSLTAFFVLQLVASGAIKSITGLHETFLRDTSQILMPAELLGRPVPNILPSVRQPILPGSGIDTALQAPGRIYRSGKAFAARVSRHFSPPPPPSQPHPSQPHPDESPPRGNAFESQARRSKVN